MHVKNVASIVQALNDLRMVASLRQQIAIDLVNPLLRELAANTELIIAKLSNNPNGVHMPASKEYVVAHTSLQQCSLYDRQLRHVWQKGKVSKTS